MPNKKYNCGAYRISNIFKSKSIPFKYGSGDFMRGKGH